MFSTLFFGLSSWWHRRASVPLDHLHFMLYTRQGCHLCEHAYRQLQAAQRRNHFHLETVDVDTLPELAARYGSLVPVVVVNGKLRFRGSVNPVLLDRLLGAEREKALRAQGKRSPPCRG